MAALCDGDEDDERMMQAGRAGRQTDRSFQKLRSSSVVRPAPCILVKRTSTPPSLGPQKALEKSRVRDAGSGEPSLVNLEKEVVDGCHLAIMFVTSSCEGGELSATPECTETHADARPEST